VTAQKTIERILPQIESKEVSTQVGGGEIDTAMSELIVLRDDKIANLRK